MTVLPEHGHCENCGDAIPVNEYFCSDECSKEYEKDVKEAKRLDNRFYIIMGAVLVGVAAVMMLLKAYVL